MWVLIWALTYIYTHIFNIFLTITTISLASVHVYFTIFIYNKMRLSSLLPLFSSFFFLLLFSFLHPRTISSVFKFFCQLKCLTSIWEIRHAINIKFIWFTAIFCCNTSHMICRRYNSCSSWYYKKAWSRQ